MRVQPRYHVGLIAVVVYSVLVVAAWGLLGVDYATTSSTTENVVRGIVVPVGFRALLGSALYVTRIATGALVAAMLLHTLWDFAGLSFAGSGAETTMLNVVGGVLNHLTIVLALVSVVVILRAKRRPASSGPRSTRVPA